MALAVPSGYVRHSYWKWPFIVPEGNDNQSVNKQFENTGIDTNIGDVSFGFKMI
jgi:hypothetical protein